MEKIKFGIVCDNYKVQRFKKEFSKAGFDDITFTENPPEMGKTTTIKVIALPSAKQKIAAICMTVEQHFKNSN